MMDDRMMDDVRQEQLYEELREELILEKEEQNPAKEEVFAQRREADAVFPRLDSRDKTSNDNERNESLFRDVEKVIDNRFEERVQERFEDDRLTPDVREEDKRGEIPKEFSNIVTRIEDTLREELKDDRSNDAARVLEIIDRDDKSDIRPMDKTIYKAAVLINGHYEKGGNSIRDEKELIRETVDFMKDVGRSAEYARDFIEHERMSYLAKYDLKVERDSQEKINDIASNRSLFHLSLSVREDIGKEKYKELLHHQLPSKFDYHVYDRGHVKIQDLKIAQKDELAKRTEPWQNFRNSEESDIKTLLAFDSGDKFSRNDWEKIFYDGRRYMEEVGRSEELNSNRADRNLEREEVRNEMLSRERERSLQRIDALREQLPIHEKLKDNILNERVPLSTMASLRNSYDARYIANALDRNNNDELEQALRDVDKDANTNKYAIADYMREDSCLNLYAEEGPVDKLPEREEYHVAPILGKDIDVRSNVDYLLKDKDNVFREHKEEDLIKALAFMEDDRRNNEGTIMDALARLTDNERKLDKAPEYTTKAMGEILINSARQSRLMQNEYKRDVAVFDGFQKTKDYDEKHRIDDLKMMQTVVKANLIQMEMHKEGYTREMIVEKLASSGQYNNRTIEDHFTKNYARTSDPVLQERAQSIFEARRDGNNPRLIAEGERLMTEKGLTREEELVRDTIIDKENIVKALREGAVNILVEDVKDSLKNDLLMGSNRVVPQGEEVRTERELQTLLIAKHLLNIEGMRNERMNMLLESRDKKEFESALESRFETRRDSEVLVESLKGELRLVALYESAKNQMSDHLFSSFEKHYEPDMKPIRDHAFDMFGSRVRMAQKEDYTPGQYLSNHILAEMQSNRYRPGQEVDFTRPEDFQFDRGREYVESYYLKKAIEEQHRGSIRTGPLRGQHYQFSVWDIDRANKALVADRAERAMGKGYFKVDGTDLYETWTQGRVYEERVEELNSLYLLTCTPYGERFVAEQNVKTSDALEMVARYKGMNLEAQSHFGAVNIHKYERTFHEVTMDRMSRDLKDRFNMLATKYGNIDERFAGKEYTDMYARDERGRDLGHDLRAAFLEKDKMERINTQRDIILQRLEQSQKGGDKRVLHVLRTGKTPERLDEEKRINLEIQRVRALERLERSSLVKQRQAQEAATERAREAIAEVGKITDILHAQRATQGFLARMIPTQQEREYRQLRKDLEAVVVANIKEANRINEELKVVSEPYESRLESLQRRLDILSSRPDAEVDKIMSDYENGRLEIQQKYDEIVAERSSRRLAAYLEKQKADDVKIEEKSAWDIREYYPDKDINMRYQARLPEIARQERKERRQEAKRQRSNDRGYMRFYEDPARYEAMLREADIRAEYNRLLEMKEEINKEVNAGELIAEIGTTIDAAQFLPTNSFDWVDASDEYRTYITERMEQLYKDTVIGYTAREQMIQMGGFDPTDPEGRGDLPNFA